MRKILLTALLALSVSAGYAHAQTQQSPAAQQAASQFCTNGTCTYIPLEPLPGFPPSYGQNQNTFPSLVGNSFKLLIGAGAIVAVIMIVLGALTYMFSDIAGNKKKALDRVRGAVWGVLLLLSSYLILVTINPELVVFNLKITPSGNFNTTPNVTGTGQTQFTQAQAQAEQNSCNQQCPLSGGVLRPQTNGTYSCTCVPTTAL